MTPMFSFQGWSVTLSICLLAQAAACGLPPPRYLPAPKSIAYYMIFGNTAAAARASSNETTEIPGYPGEEYDYENKWKMEDYEIAGMGGYGMGSFLFLRGIDLALYVPFYFRNFENFAYLNYTDVGTENTRAGSTLHTSILQGQPGSGLGDVSVSVMSLIMARPATGTWGTGALKLVFPTGRSAARQFTRILHGDETPPGAGRGVMQVVPALSGVKSVAGQRAYFDLEYVIPLGTETFSFTSPDLTNKYDDPFLDAAMPFEEEFKHGGILLFTIGMETTLEFLGMNPSVELSVRQMQAATWTENGVNGLETLAAPYYSDLPVLTTAYPTHTPGFLTDAAWAIGRLPLKDNTEIEIGLLGTWRIRNSSIVKAGVSYTADSFGHAATVKISFTNLFLKKTEEQLEAELAGTIRAREIEVSPVIGAPPAPAKSVNVAVSFPAAGRGVSLEEADWLAQRLREGMSDMPGYSLFPAREMAQLAQTPCGDATCGSRFARALGVDAMLIGRLARVNGGFSFEAELISAAGELAAAARRIAPNLGELGDQLPGLIEELTRIPEQETR